jgi:uncharacterized tellurite resistance protein B-like protein
MSDQSTTETFRNVESVIADDLKFKAYLGIGENAYASLKVKNAVTEIWDTLGAASAGATIAGSSTIATTFFAHNAVFAALGLASTPVGWIIAAGALSGGAWLGITRHFNKLNKERITVIPQFINTPIDIFGLALFELLAPLALKMAHVDGDLDDNEINLIKNYFIKKWGYDSNFVEGGILYLNENLERYTIKETATSLAEYKKQNPDCEYDSMSKEIIGFLRDIIEADGRIDEREIMALDAVKKIFNEAGQFDIKKNIKNGILNTRKDIKKGIKNARINLSKILS